MIALGTKTFTEANKVHNSYGGPLGYGLGLLVLSEGLFSRKRS